MSDPIELQPPGPDLETAPVDGDFGELPKPNAPLAAVPRFERRAIIAAVVLQLLVLIVMILGKTIPYLHARRVLVKVLPVDPRDMFRGDYVTLSYDFSMTHDKNYVTGEAVYVTLVPDPDGRHYHTGGFGFEPPMSGVFIRGTASGFGRATYGIESYYVQEGKGHDYENAIRSKQLWADVALDGKGTASLKGLVIE